MFGKNDGFDDYGDCSQSDNYGYNAETSTDDVKSIFQPFLEEGEEILWSMCNGNPYAQSPVENSKLQSLVRKMSITKNMIFVVALIGALFMIFGGVILFLTGILVIFAASLIEKLLKFLLIGVIAAIIIWALKPENRNNKCYAITDRRLVMYGYSQFTEIRLEDIRSTKAVISRENNGKIVAKGLLLLIIIPSVEDPYRVKYILDDAIENCRSNQSQC